MFAVQSVWNNFLEQGLGSVSILTPETLVSYIPLFIRDLPRFCIECQKIYRTDTYDGVNNPCQPSGAEDELYQIKIEESDKSPVQSPDDTDGEG